MRRVMGAMMTGLCVGAWQLQRVHARDAKGEDQYPYACPDLPYPYDSLAAKGISAETLRFHHDKHHAGYVSKLNATMKERAELQAATLMDLIMTQQGPIFNLAAQIWNHTFYWHSMSPSGGGMPHGPLLAAILWKWGTFEAFQKEFDAHANGHFGSGWAWLVANADGTLEVTSTHDAQNPVTEGKTPLLTCDVWEHAYYIDCKNDRPAYVKNWWKTVNWEFANQKLAEVQRRQTGETIEEVVQKVEKVLSE